MVSNDNIIKHLKLNSEWLQQQQVQYSRDFVTKFGYETLPTLIAGVSTMVVPPYSAIVRGAPDAESVPIDADHNNMVKFNSSEDDGYLRVAGHLGLLVEEAPGAVKARWTQEDNVENAKLNAEDFSIPFSLSGISETQYFVGRKEELRRMNKTFRGDGSHRITIVLQGLGGVGKTQLAVAFIKQQRDAYTAIFWLNGKNEDTVKRSFGSIATRLHRNYPSSPLLKAAAEATDVNQTVEAIKRWLSDKNNTRWILVFDNVDNPKLRDTKPDPQTYNITLYFPEAHQGFILITTRSSQLNIGEVIHVKKFGPTQKKESIAILAHMSRRKISDQDPDAVTIAKRLDGLPLALATAGAYLRQVSCTLEEYLLYYEKKWTKLQETSPKLASYNRDLYSTWDLSFEYIKTRNACAAKLLQLWAYFDNQDLWYSLLANGIYYGPEWFTAIVKDELSFNEAIRLLSDHALVESHSDSGGYSMHSCVHDWTLHGLNSNHDPRMPELALVCVGYGVPEERICVGVDDPYWTLMKRLRPHAHKCLESARLGRLNSEQGRMKEPRIMWLQRLVAIKNLTDFYCNGGKLEEAVDICMCALKRLDKLCGQEKSLTLSMIICLGRIHQNFDKKEEAEKMYKWAFQAYKRHYGPEHILTLNSLNSLASIDSAQFKIKDEVQTLIQALEGFQKTGEQEYRFQITTIERLGHIYIQLGELKKAEKIFIQALERFEGVWGPEHISTLIISSHLGRVYTCQGRLKMAELMYLRAWHGLEKGWGREHRVTSLQATNLAHHHADQDKGAEHLYHYVLKKKEETWGREHMSTLLGVFNLGQIYAGQDKMKAEQMFMWALQGYEKVLGREHALTFEIVTDLAHLYADQGETEKAEEMRIRALQGYKKTLGDYQEIIDYVYDVDEVPSFFFSKKPWRVGA